MKVLLFAVAIAGSSHNSVASETTVPRLSGPVKVDGVLDEGAWADVTRRPLEVEIRPRQLGVAGVQTMASLWHDGQILYVGVEALDEEPGRVKASSAVRDSWARSDDHVALVIDSEGRGRRGYTFRINAEGSMADEIQSGVGESASDWNGSWSGAARKTVDGYHVEFSIPLSTLGIRVRSTETIELRVNVERVIGRERRETVSLAPIDRAASCGLCQIPAQRLERVDMIRGEWRINPYVSASLDRRYSAPAGTTLSSQQSAEIGVDVSWKPRQGLTVLGTINPDFSQVEIDAIQFSVNKRFALTFPEKRPFFTEDPGMFRSRLPLVYTRSITNPDWGIQALSRSTSGSWGLLFADDQFTSFILPNLDSSRAVSLDTPSQNSVARYERSLDEDLTLGTLLTSRQADAYRNDVASFDGRWRLGKRSLVTWQFAQSRTDNPLELQTRFRLDATQKGAAWDVGYSYTGDVYSNSFSIQEIDSDFRADLGTLNQVGVRKIEHNSAWSWTGEPEQRVSSRNLSFGASQTDDVAGGTIFRTAGLYGGVGFANGWSVDVGGNVSEETFEEITYQLSEGTVTVIGEITDEFTLVPTFSLSEGIDYELTQVGEYQTLSVGASYRPSSDWRFSPSIVNEEFSVDGFGLRFRTSAFRLKTVWSPKEDHQLTAVVNMARVDVVDAIDRSTYSSEDIQGQIVYNWRRGPFASLYLGYTGLGRGDTFIGSANRTRDYYFVKWVIEL